MSATPDRLPVIDLAGGALGRELDRACREHGFFYVTGHGVDPGLIASLAWGWRVHSKICACSRAYQHSTM